MHTHLARNILKVRTVTKRILQRTVELLKGLCAKHVRHAFIFDVGIGMFAPVTFGKIPALFRIASSKLLEHGQISVESIQSKYDQVPATRDPSSTALHGLEQRFARFGLPMKDTYCDPNRHECTEEVHTPRDNPLR